MQDRREETGLNFYFLHSSGYRFCAMRCFFSVFSCSCARAFSLFTQTLVAACSYFLYRLVIVWWSLKIISSWYHHFTLATKSHNHLAVFCFSIDNCVTGLLILLSSIEYSLYNKKRFFVTLFWVVNNIFYQYVAFNYLKKITVCDIGWKVLYNLSVVCAKATKQQHIHLPSR